MRSVQKLDTEFWWENMVDAIIMQQLVLKQYHSWHLFLLFEIIARQSRNNQQHGNFYIFMFMCYLMSFLMSIPLQIRTNVFELFFVLDLLFPGRRRCVGTWANPSRISCYFEPRQHERCVRNNMVALYSVSISSAVGGSAYKAYNQLFSVYKRIDFNNQ